MKILAIRIRNLASLEGNTEIDFTTEPLRSAGIFAITGATGAGKSTILDALCLALYAKTPRYLQAKETGVEIRDVLNGTLSQGDVRSILRDGTAEGFAEVDFEGTDGQHYRAGWRVRRARNKADGSMQSDSVTLRNLTSNVDIPGKKQETLNETARLVGLNFDQFTRSVLLAQGDFTAFMKAGKDEKSSLLEKLTGTHIYSEISKKIYENFKLEEQQLRDLTVRKEGIATLTDEELKELSDEQATLETQISSLEKNIEELTAEIAWHEQLVKLETSYDDAVTALQHANDARLTALPLRQKLLVTEHAQLTRTWADALKRAQQQHAEKAAALAALNESIATLHQKKESLETQLRLSEARLAETDKSLAEAQPLLDQARRLDTLLAEKKEQAEKLKEDAESASEANSRHQTILTARQDDYANLASQIESIVNWMTENTERSPVAENKDLILSKLADAQKLLQTAQAAAAELEGLKDKIYKDENLKIQTEAAREKQQHNLELLRENYDTNTKALLLTPVEALNLDKTETDRQIETTIKAQAVWQLFYNSLAELETLGRKQVENQADYRAKQDTLQQLAGQLPVEKAQKDTAYQLLQRARLAAAENVETLRDTLADDEPCPVCGSTSHPYAVHNPQLDHILALLEKSYNEKEQSYLRCHSQHSALEQACSTLEQTIQRLSEEVSLKKTALQARRHAWEQSDIVVESGAVADADRSDWIEQKIQSLKVRQAGLQEKIQDYTDRKLKLEADKAQIDQLKETTDRLSNQLNDIRSGLSVYHEQQSSKAKEREKAVADLNETDQLLSPYFTASDWMDNWKSAPLVFVERIDRFSRKWKENTEKLEQYNRQKVALEATIRELGNQAGSLLSEVGKKTEAYRVQHGVLLDLNRQRSEIFAGKPAEEIEAGLKLAQTDARQQLELLKGNQRQLDIDITKSNTQIEELAAILTALKIDAQNASQQMQDWISDYNQQNNGSINIETLYELLALSNDWIHLQRAALQTIDEKATSAGSVLSERRQTLEDHRQKGISGRSLEELNTLLSEAKREAGERKNKKAENSFRLQEDKAGRNKIGDLLNSIAKQAVITENWSKLNEIIGSADGKKFRQIAQEYTLDVLLGYANIHLQALTSRYKIERIPVSLGLQVVDQDMGDEVRTVYSLSGGESFLVSLALALGLASLSSSRMKVESLFIDEGFGSLDPATLNVAMDALERLHNQGRKVGVISHVQEMTERIPVQIKVSKHQSGKSRVEVVGA